MEIAQPLHQFTVNSKNKIYRNYNSHQISCTIICMKLFPEITKINQTKLFNFKICNNFCIYRTKIKFNKINVILQYHKEIAASFVNLTSIFELKNMDLSEALTFVWNFKPNESHQLFLFFGPKYWEIFYHLPLQKLF